MDLGLDSDEGPEPFELTNRLLEVFLLTFLYLALVYEDGLVDCVIEALRVRSSVD